jgi:hypothetical protein
MCNSSVKQLIEEHEADMARHAASKKVEGVDLTLPAQAPHFHPDGDGLLVKCFHRCRSTLGPSFWLGTMVSFPLEHFLYEKVWPFTLITHWMGL